ncbi:MAG: hypothetical protein AMXMBFR83_13620 [Phycisphaerae bacterium]
MGALALSVMIHWVAAVGADEAGPRVYGPHRFLARSATREARESSGVAPSHFDPEVFWTHGDSGEARVHAFRLSAEDRGRGLAADLGSIRFRGQKFEDCEDLAAGPEQTLYLFDGGNNPPCGRTNKRIFRFKEPKVDWTRPARKMNLALESLRFEYPAADRPDRPAMRDDERYDAECLLVHPATGDLYVVTKRDSRDRPAARVYRLPGAGVRWNGPEVYVLRFVADLSGVIGGRTVAGMVTGGAVSPDGRRVVLRTYLTAYEFAVPAGRPFEEVFAQKPRAISLLGEPQGEAVCYAANGDLILTSEATPRDPRFPIYLVPCLTGQATPAARPATRPEHAAPEAKGG